MSERDRREALAAEMRQQAEKAAERLAGPNRRRDAMAAMRGALLAVEHGFRVLGLGADVAADTMSGLAERIKNETDKPGGDHG